MGGENDHRPPTSDLWGSLVQLRVRIGLIFNERQLLVVLVESFSGVISTKISIITSLVRERFCRCSYRTKGFLYFGGAELRDASYEK